MAYFRSFFGGGEKDPEEENGLEIVEKLVQRLETCTDQEDRRDALRTLRSMAKKLRVAVGSLGMNSFIDVLEKERQNHELLALALDVLTILLSSADETTDDDELGERFAEMMLRKKTFIPALLAAVEEFEFNVRRFALQLLTSLLRHRGSEAQAAIMGQAKGVPSLVDSIHDTREVVRNEAILMLCELSRNNSQIQQLMAYDGAFIHLLDIICMEPIDSIVIEDSLFVLLNLLRRNSMNQQLFVEHNLVVRLNDILQMFLYGTEDMPDTGDWSKQRTANIIFLLQIIRSLVSPDNTGTNTHSAQKAIYQCQMLTVLCRVLLSESGVSVEILTETVIAVAECIRGNYTNQEYFSSLSLPTGENTVRPSLLVLLFCMTSEKQPFKLRCAVFYCFLAYLHENEFGKTKIIETLLTTSESDSVTTGFMVCQALSAAESVQSWFGSVSLLHCLIDVPHLREQLLRVQLNLPGEEAVLLLNHVSNQLCTYGNRRVQARAGLLMLLCVWLTECPAAVSLFTANQENLTYLTTQIMDECGEGTESEQMVLKGLMAFLLLSCLNGTTDNNARKSLEQLLDRRVRRDVLSSCLDGLSRTEQFVRAAQKPQPLAKVPQELCLDYHFIRVYKQYEGTLGKIMRGGDVSTTANNENIIQSFKDLIKRQDEEISNLKQEHKHLESENDELRSKLERSRVDEEVEKMRLELEQAKVSSQQNEATQLQLQEMHRVNEQWKAEVEKYKLWAQQWQQYQVAQIPNFAETVAAQLQQQVASLEQQLYYGYEAFEDQGKKMAQLTAECAEWQKRAEQSEAAAAAAVTATGNVANGATNHDEEVEKMRTEQEELLMLLADQHNKITSYKRQLRLLKQEVSDDEDE